MSTQEREVLRITEYLDPSSIVFLSAATRDEALETLVERLSSNGKIDNPQSFYQAVLNREKIISTGIGMGVAIPHAKRDDFTDFFIAMGIQKQKGIEWNAIDRAPVRLIFLIGGPEKKQTQYLQILSGLTTAIRCPSFRRRMLKTQEAEEAFSLFQQEREEAYFFG